MRGRIGILAVLSEAIDASAIDRVARKELRDALLETLGWEWKRFLRAYPDPSWEDMHNIYDDFYQKHRHGSPDYEQFIKNLCMRATAILTHVTQHAIEQRFGYNFDIRIGEQVVPVTAEECYVAVEPREFTEDKHSHYGGYFSNLQVRVFVNADDVHTTAMGLVQEIAFGEGEDTHALVNVIAPVFVHEYVHLEQYIRGSSVSRRDMGYISVKGRKRLETRRNPDNGNLAALLYKSSATEIDSFAADTASTIIAGFHGRDFSFNSDLNYALEGIAGGYVDTPSLRSYTNLAWGEWDEVAKFYNIPRHELRQTYQRFLKQVYKKLWFYRKDKMGKAEWQDHSSLFNNIPEQWIEWAKKNPMARTAALIAYDIAFNHADIKYGEGNHLLHKGAQFIEFYYFNADWEFEKSMKIHRAFTAMVERQHAKMALPKAA